MVEPPTKQARQSDGAGKSSSDSLLNSLKSRRKQTASSITEFSFNKKRCRVLGRVEDVKEGAKGVLYWMSRDQRVQVSRA
ncbi:unnamed protein product [Cyprideis torosa]|uniref:Uncharacterized protein n=1 Tax=Cyprideis torosa TaxID=163714 RepID=A0A7R8WDM4_9CRUS|nr:unnamed protein product [Cyprideis torosa]CAG0894805.1 unnamed protein product [Cyprideis torosa]